MRDPVVDVILHELGIDALEQLPATVAVIDDAQLTFATALANLPAAEPPRPQPLPRIRVFTDTGADPHNPDTRTALNHPAIAEITELDEGLFDDADLVIGRLPKSLAELDEIAELAAMQAAPGVTLMLGGREKFLNRSMNEQLARHFGAVRATRGMRKSRALVATDPRPRAQPQATPSYPKTAHITDLGLTVKAHGAAFAGTGYDIGTRALIESLEAAQTLAELPHVTTAVDLGCGTGILAAWLAAKLPDADVIATDRSWAACASARATAEGNGLERRIQVVRANAGDGIQASSADLILLNPPFHEGHEVQQGMANELFRAAARILKPGGTLITVFNSHLRHRDHLERIVGATTQLARTAKFTVTRTTR